MLSLLFLISFISVCFLLLFILCTIYKPKLLSIIIPIMFSCLFLLIYLIPNYLGYAIESKFLNGREAAVINVVEGSSLIYMTVILQNEDQPRLVSMPNTKDNKEMADEAMRKSKEGIVIIRFGEEQKNGAGSGEEGTGYSSSAQITDLQHSNSMSKPQ